MLLKWGFQKSWRESKFTMETLSENEQVLLLHKPLLKAKIMQHKPNLTTYYCCNCKQPPKPVKKRTTTFRGEGGGGGGRRAQQINRRTELNAWRTKGELQQTTVTFKQFPSNSSAARSCEKGEQSGKKTKEEELWRTGRTTVLRRVENGACTHRAGQENLLLRSATSLRHPRPVVPRNRKDCEPAGEDLALFHNILLLSFLKLFFS